MTKEEANYTARSMTKRCHTCSFWLEGNSCVNVQGRINPNGTCKQYFKA